MAQMLSWDLNTNNRNTFRKVVHLRIVAFIIFLSSSGFLWNVEILFLCFFGYYALIISIDVYKSTSPKYIFVIFNDFS